MGKVLVDKEVECHCGHLEKNKARYLIRKNKYISHRSFLFGVNSSENLKGVNCGCHLSAVKPYCETLCEYR